MKKIGVFAGNFNPPHFGQVQSLAAAVQTLGLDKVLILPWMEEGSVSPEHKLALCCLAFGNISGADIQPWILESGEASAAAALATARKHYPDCEIWLLVGADSFVKLPHQVQTGEHICILETGSPNHLAEARGRAGENCSFCSGGLDIAAVQLRRLLAFQAGDIFLPSSVHAYIRENGLYYTKADWKKLPMEELRAIALKLLHPNRVKHVIGVMETAEKMAQHWGCDPVDAARAGLLHDVTKALDGPLQLTLCEAYGKILSDFDRKYPRTLHALTGSLVAERIFGENEAVVQAIACHTTGKADMSVLEKIIYVADYMEPNRDFPGVEKLRQLAYSDLTGALKLGLEMTLEHLHRQGNEVSKASMDALSFLNQ